MLVLIGKQMMNYIKKIANDENCDTIELQVNSKNTNAIKFYEHFGMLEKIKTMELILDENDKKN